MKQLKFLSLLLAIAGTVCVTSCKKDDNTPKGMNPADVNPTLLIGKWRNDGNPNSYKKFTTDTAVFPNGKFDPSYDKYGSDWTLGDKEEDEEGTEFFYKVEGNQLKELYDNMGTPLPRIYTFKTLTHNKLEYFDHYNEIYSFTKQ
jgi:hypothetical protein